MLDEFTLEGGIQNRELKIVCTGQIKGYEEYKVFKHGLFELANSDEMSHLKQNVFDVLEVKFIDSYPLPNCLIGFFLKLYERDNISVNLITNENKMLSFFISMYLDEKLNVKLFL